MKIVYLHHAERAIGENHLDPILRQEEDITELGIEEAKLIGKQLGKKQVTAIYTSPYLRCRHTAEIINEYQNVEIIDEPRFNEKEYGESWESLLKRNCDALDDIVNKYNDDDIILCVTSGVNLSAFVCYFYGIEPSNDVPWCQGTTISPVNFMYGKTNAD